MIYFKMCTLRLLYSCPCEPSTSGQLSTGHEVDEPGLPVSSRSEMSQSTSEGTDDTLRLESVFAF